MGKKVTVTKIINNFPNESKEADEETVLLEVKSETDGTYTGTPGVSEFRLVVNGQEFRSDYSITDALLKEKDLTPYATMRAQVGKPAVGYVGFTIPKDSSKVTFRYTRGETKILGGQSLPAKSFDVVIRE